MRERASGMGRAYSQTVIHRGEIGLLKSNGSRLRGVGSTAVKVAWMRHGVALCGCAGGVEVICMWVGVAAPDHPLPRAACRMPTRAGTDEDYHVMTRGKLLDRIRVALAGGYAVRMALGEETNFTAAGEEGSCAIPSQSSHTGEQ